MSPQPATKADDNKPVIDIPAGHPSPFMEDEQLVVQPQPMVQQPMTYIEESPKTKLTQVVQPILKGKNVFSNKFDIAVITSLCHKPRKM